MKGTRLKPHLLKTPSLSKQRKKELALFERQSGARFRNNELLNLAFCHRSYANETTQTVDNNEKLEFLGDSVLGIVISELLFFSLHERNEGEMAKVKSFVVSEKSLAKVARRLRVDNFILIGKGEEYSGGRSKNAIFADAMEAIIGAYYLDSGFDASRKFVRDLFEPEIQAVLQNRHAKDYKTLLQEYVQKTFKTYPRYSVVQKSGPDHDRTFLIRVIINEREHGTGTGKNKKEAEQAAAAEAYRSLVGSQNG